MLQTFFMDTDPSVLMDRIVAVCGESPYSIEQLREILFPRGASGLPVESSLVGRRRVGRLSDRVARITDPAATPSWQAVPDLWFRLDARMVATLGAASARVP